MRVTHISHKQLLKGHRVRAANVKRMLFLFILVFKCGTQLHGARLCMCKLAQLNQAWCYSLMSRITICRLQTHLRRFASRSMFSLFPFAFIFVTTQERTRWKRSSNWSISLWSTDLQYSLDTINNKNKLELCAQIHYDSFHCLCVCVFLHGIILEHSTTSIRSISFLLTFWAGSQLTAPIVTGSPSILMERDYKKCARRSSVANEAR